MSFDGNQVGFPQLDTPFVKENKKDPGAARIIDLPWYRLLIALWNRTGGSSGSTTTSVKPGCLVDFAGPVTNIPVGYLLCDGTFYQVSAFPDLFAAIEYSWGGAGPSFAVPNLINRTTIGAGGLYTLGAVGGGSTTLNVGQLPPHNHGITDPGHIHAVTDPGHVHGERGANNNTAGTTGIQGGTAANDTTIGTTASATTGVSVNSATTGITTQNTGTGNSVPTIPPFGAILKIIKT